MTLTEIIAQLRREPEWNKGTAHDILLCCVEPWPNYGLVARTHNATRSRLMAALDALEDAVEVIRDWAEYDVEHSPEMKLITTRLAKAL
jgi:hypothetical protein